MSKLTVRRIVLLAAMFVLVGSMAVMAEKPEAYRICHLAPLTGDASFQGQILINAAKLAVDEINAAGGINGVPIEYIPVDETSSSSAGIDAVRKAIAMDPVAVVGPNRSGTILAAENLWRQAKIPFLVDGTNAEITKRGNPYTFRMQVESTYWIPLLVRTAKEYYNVEKPAVMYGLNEYSKGLWVATEPAFKEYGLEPVTVQTYNDGDRDFTAQLLKIKAAGADALFLYGYEAEQGIILRQRTELGMKDLRVYGERGLASPAVEELAGRDNIEGIVCTTSLSPGDPDPGRQEFIAKYYANFPGGMSPTHVGHYDTIYILADIISRVGADREAIQDAMANLDYEGTLGHYICAKDGNCLHTIYTQIFEDGKWNLLLREDYPVER